MAATPPSLDSPLGAPQPTSPAPDATADASPSLLSLSEPRPVASSTSLAAPLRLTRTTSSSRQPGTTRRQPTQERINSILEVRHSFMRSQTNALPNTLLGRSASNAPRPIPPTTPRHSRASPASLAQALAPAPATAAPLSSPWSRSWAATHHQRPRQTRTGRCRHRRRGRHRLLAGHGHGGPSPAATKTHEQNRVAVEQQQQQQQQQQAVDLEARRGRARACPARTAAGAAAGGGACWPASSRLSWRTRAAWHGTTWRWVSCLQSETETPVYFALRLASADRQNEPSSHGCARRSRLPPSASPSRSCSASTPPPSTAATRTAATKTASSRLSTSAARSA